MRNKRSDFLLRNTKGQGLSVNAIILIILGIVVLAILILGFTIGFDRLLPFVQKNNIDNIQAACSIACSTQNQFDFCSVQRNVNDGSREEFPTNCYDLATNSSYDGRNYGIDECPAITCEQAEEN